jgi:hypothetical protein
VAPRHIFDSQLHFGFIEGRDRQPQDIFLRLVSQDGGR